MTCMTLIVCLSSSLVTQFMQRWIHHFKLCSQTFAGDIKPQWVASIVLRFLNCVIITITIFTCHWLNVTTIVDKFYLFSSLWCVWIHSQFIDCHFSHCILVYKLLYVLGNERSWFFCSRDTVLGLTELQG